MGRDSGLEGDAPGPISDAGFRAASEVVERFLSSMSGTASKAGNHTEPGSTGPGTGGPGTGGSQRSAFRQLRADLARAVDANLDLIRKAFDLYAGAVDRILGAEQAGAGDASSHLTMPPVLPGHRASSTLWIHNTTSSMSPALRIHASDLVSHSGDVIKSNAFEFDPAEIDIAPPDSSLAVAVSLAVDAGVAPGRYRGHVFVTNLPTEYMTIEVEVVGPVGANQGERWQARRQAS